MSQPDGESSPKTPLLPSPSTPQHLSGVKKNTSYTPPQYPVITRGSSGNHDLDDEININYSNNLFLSPFPTPAGQKLDFDKPSQHLTPPLTLGALSHVTNPSSSSSSSSSNSHEDVVPIESYSPGVINEGRVSHHSSPYQTPSQVGQVTNNPPLNSTNQYPPPHRQYEIATCFSPPSITTTTTTTATTTTTTTTQLSHTQSHSNFSPPQISIQHASTPTNTNNNLQNNFQNSQIDNEPYQFHSPLSSPLPIPPPPTIPLNRPFTNQSGADNRPEQSRNQISEMRSNMVTTLFDTDRRGSDVIPCIRLFQVMWNIAEIIPTVTLLKHDWDKYCDRFGLRIFLILRCCLDFCLIILHCCDFTTPRQTTTKIFKTVFAICDYCSVLYALIMLGDSQDCNRSTFILTLVLSCITILIFISPFAILGFICCCFPLSLRLLANVIDFSPASREASDDQLRSLPSIKWGTLLEKRAEKNDKKMIDKNNQNKTNGDKKNGIKNEKDDNNAQTPHVNCVYGSEYDHRDYEIDINDPSPLESPDNATNNIQETLDCPICMIEFEKDDEIGILPCNHDLHFECIKNWLKLNNSCPLCRTPVFRQPITMASEPDDIARFQPMTSLPMAMV